MPQPIFPLDCSKTNYHKTRVYLHIEQGLRILFSTCFPSKYNDLCLSPKRTIKKTEHIHCLSTGKALCSMSRPEDDLRSYSSCTLMPLMTQVLSHWSRTFRLGYESRLYLSQLSQLDAKILFMCLLDTFYTSLLMC